MKNIKTVFIKSEPHKISKYVYDFFECTHNLTGRIFYARKKRNGSVYTSVSYARKIDSKKWKSGLINFLKNLD